MKDGAAASPAGPVLPVAGPGEMLTEHDLNHDGKPDVWKVTRRAADVKDVLVRRERDLNDDGKIDAWEAYDQAGNLVSQTMDLDFDGKRDLVLHFEKGQLVRKEMGFGFDGKAHAWAYYEKGKLARKERDENGDGRVDYWEYWESGEVDPYRMRRQPSPRPSPSSSSGLDAADARELDARLRQAIRLEQQLLTEMGPLLLAVARSRSYRAHGCPNVGAFAREWLGMSPRRAQALLRLERTCQLHPPLRQAYRSGRLSWTQANALVPIVGLDHADPWREQWIAHAERVTVRRLEEDVDRALATGVLDPAARPAERSDAQTGAPSMGPEETETLFFTAPVDVARLFKAVLATAQRRIEHRTQALTMLARCRLNSGDVASAKSLLLAAVAADPTGAVAYAYLTQVDPEAMTADMAAALEQAMRLGTSNASERAMGLLALARREETIGEHERAFRRFVEAKSHLAATARASGGGYDPATVDEAVARIRTVNDAPFDAGEHEGRQRLIFIVGMPRSGTSLTEQILSCHSSVFGAGELPTMLDIMRTFTAAPARDILRRAIAPRDC